MGHLLQSLIMSLAVIAIASPSFAGDDRDDKMWDRDKKEQSHDSKKDKHHGNPFDKIMEQLDDLNDKLDELLANGVDLRGVTQNWDKELDSTNGDANGCNSERFTCIWPTVEHPDGAAVRDNETGLVWERSPTINSNWVGTAFRCLNLGNELITSSPLPGRQGWRLPSANELGSLVDSSVAFPGPVLPQGHPFLNVQSANYWSATTFANDPAQAYEVFFGNGTITGSSKSRFFNGWCVRGGMNASDQY